MKCSSIISLFFLLLCAMLVAGCENPVTNSVHVDPTFTSIQQNVFARSCTFAGSCHAAFRPLSLEAADAYNNLVGVRPDNLTALNKGLLRVFPGKPDSSFLLIKLTGPGPGEGDRMPHSNDPLSQQAIDAIRTWIAN